MNPENIVLVRFDYVLGHQTETVVNNFSGILGDVDTSMATTGIRGDNRTDEIYYTDDVDRLRELGYAYFKSLAVRITEPTKSITEIVSIVQVNNQFIDELQPDYNSISFKIDNWEKNLESQVREHIPGEKGGSETTIVLFKLDQLPNSLSNHVDDINRIRTDFSDGVESKFIQACGESPSGGVINLDDKVALFLTNSQNQPYGKLIGIDITGLASPPHGRGIKIPRAFSAVSTLLSIHYWCAVRGKSLNKFDDRVRQSKENLPSTQESSKNVISQINLERDVYQIQQDWGVTRSEIAKDHSQLKNLIDNWEPVYESSSLWHYDNGDILSQYRHNLQRNLDDVEKDSQRIHQSILSISEFTNNQLSVAATRENIELQERVRYLTFLIFFLTVILVIDAIIPGGVSAIIESIFDWLAQLFEFYVELL